MPAIRNIVVCGGIGGLIGAGAVWLALSGRAPANAPLPAVTSPRSADEARTAAVPLLEAAALRAAIGEEVRGALREEVEAAPASSAGAAAIAKPTQEPTPAYAKARDHVSARLSAGAWSAADRDHLRLDFAEMNDHEREELMKRVILAANSGGLRVDLEGPLF